MDILNKVKEIFQKHDVPLEVAEKQEFSIKNAMQDLDDAASRVDDGVTKLEEAGKELGYAMSKLKHQESREMLADMQDEIHDAKLELFRFYDGKMDDLLRNLKQTTDGVERIEKMSSDKPNHMSTDKVKDEEEKYTDEVKDEEEQMASATLASGQVIESDGEIAVGSKVSVTTEEGEKVAVPAGTYDLEGGGSITVDESGTITEVSGAEAMEEEEEEEKKLTEKDVEKIVQSAMERVMEKFSAQVNDLQAEQVKLNSQKALDSVVKGKKKKATMPSRDELAKMETRDIVSIIANQYK